MTTTELERSVGDLIEAALEKVEIPDTNAVAELVIRDLDPERVEYYAVRGVAEHVRSYLRSCRRPAESGPTSSARWDSVKEQAQSGELDLTRWRVFTGAGLKWLLDCDHADLLSAADQSEMVAAGHRRTAESYRRLAEVLGKKRGAKVVGDLAESKVRGLLNA